MKHYLGVFMLAIFLSGCASFSQNKAPQISGIPSINIVQENSATFKLDDYVSDESKDSELTWTYLGNNYVSVSIDSSRIATITAPDTWTGTEVITFTVADPSGLSSSTSVSVTVTSKTKTITTFSDGSEQEVIEFPEQGAKSASINLPLNITVMSASVTLTGELIQKTTYDSARVYYGTTSSIYPFRAETSVRTTMLYLGSGGSGIGKSGIIDKLCFQKFDNTSNIFNNINISLCETEKNVVFADFKGNCANPTLVLSQSSLNISDGAHDWYCIDIENIFNYSSTKNLIIDLSYSSASNSTSIKLKGANVPSTESRFVYTDNLTAETGLTYPTIPNINLTFLDITSNYPSDLVFEVGKTAVKTFYGSFNTTETIDITESLNSAVKDCSGSCTVDLRLISGSSGKVRLNNLVIDYK